jgi:hypothetical protein
LLFERDVIELCCGIRKLSGAFLLASRLGARVDARRLWDGVMDGYVLRWRVCAGGPFVKQIIANLFSILSMIVNTLLAENDKSKVSQGISDVFVIQGQLLYCEDLPYKMSNSINKSKKTGVYLCCSWAEWLIRGRRGTREQGVGIGTELFCVLGENPKGVFQTQN